MALNYDTYVQQIANLLVIGSTDANFLTMLPGMIDYSEGRCYRELDLLTTRISTTVTLSSGVRTVALSTTSGYFRVVENASVYTSTSVTSSNATRSPLTMVSRDFIDAVYPSASNNTGLPLFSAMASDTTLLFGPSPSAGYTVEVVGTIQPSPLSSGNSSTFLTQNLSDLFIAASMIFGSAYMRDFGSESDNPKMSASWDAQYATLFQSANIEFLRQKYQSGGWTHAQPSPIATPQRV